MEKPDAFSFNAPHKLYLEVDVFQQFENRYDAIYQEIISQPNLSMVTAQFICTFFVQMKLRNPYHFKEFVEKKKAANLQQAIQKIMDSDGCKERFENVDPLAKEMATQLVFEPDFLYLTLAR
ncbi:DUF4238 domain-containing protein [Chitinophaga sp. 22321]|uniref:Uncharacterized protein n=1 Tax=Chitinophaga hostae TaxID=2831022 RepID=A0ABS5IZB9_9BACT|nr:hypothetical protein [Chitinophaga hostae]MBS0028245.1 hypothetical protein [Chitinophaga hostae]